MLEVEPPDSYVYSLQSSSDTGMLGEDTGSANESVNGLILIRRVSKVCGWATDNGQWNCHFNHFWFKTDMSPFICFGYIQTDRLLRLHQGETLYVVRLVFDHVRGRGKWWGR